MKKIINVVTALVLLVLCVLPTKAQAAEEIVPFYDNINSVYAYLSIDESTGIASCTGMMSAKNFYPVSVTMNLQRLSNGFWETLYTWSDSGTWSVTCDGYYAVYSGYSYRVIVQGYVYDSAGNIIESGSAVQVRYY